MEPEQRRNRSLMLDFYGGLLTPRQREVCEQYFNDDLSLSEIAENTGITRQGVGECLKKAEAILNEAEAALGACALWQTRRARVDALEKRLAALGVTDPEVMTLLEALRV